MMNLRILGSGLCVLPLLVGQAWAQNGYVVGVAPPNLPTVANTYSLTVVHDISGGHGPYLVNLAPGADPSTVTPEVASNPNVSSIEADESVLDSEESPTSKTQAVIDQLSDALAASSLVPYFGSQVRSAYLQQSATTSLELSAAQQYTTGAGIVAVIDTGVDPNHPALAGALVPGYDFIRNQATIPNEIQDLDAVTSGAVTNSSSVPQTSKTEGFQLQGSTVAILDHSTVAILDGASLPAAFGHGTMTAGLIHLVAPTASIMPLKAFHSDGSANLSDIVRAIYFAVNNGAKVINMSFDIEIQSPQLQNAIAYAAMNHVILVAAAGNDGEQEVVYPASLPRVIGVGSTDSSDVRSSFSNYGSTVFMAAPGEALITTFPGGNYAGVWGTSFSTALVSGAVASLVGLNSDAGYWSISNALRAGAPVPQQEVGSDRLDVLTSVQTFLQGER